jgi:hypothetical protein
MWGGGRIFILSPVTKVVSLDQDTNLYSNLKDELKAKKFQRMHPCGPTLDTLWLSLVSTLGRRKGIDNAGAGRQPTTNIGHSMTLPPYMGKQLAWICTRKILEM